MPYVFLFVAQAHNTSITEFLHHVSSSVNTLAACPPACQEPGPLAWVVGGVVAQGRARQPPWPWKPDSGDSQPSLGLQFFTRPSLRTVFMFCSKYYSRRVSRLPSAVGFLHRRPHGRP